MNIINKILLLSIMILSLFIMSNIFLFAEYIPSKFAIIPYASIGYFSTEYNCDVNLYDGTKKLEAKSNFDSSVIFKNYGIGVKFEIYITKSIIFTPEIELQQNKINSYRFNDNDIITFNLQELNVEAKSSYINIPLMLNFYFLNHFYTGIGPKLHYNITNDDNQIFPVNPFVISGSAVLGGFLENEYGSFILGLFADRTLTNIYKNEDFITKYNNKISSIFGKNLRIGAIMGFKIPIIK